MGERERHDELAERFGFRPYDDQSWFDESAPWLYQRRRYVEVDMIGVTPNFDLAMFEQRLADA